MNPTITILDYLYEARNSWFVCDCGEACSVEERIENYLDELMLQDYADVAVYAEGAVLRLIRKTAEEWDEEIGPKAQDQALQRQLDQYIDAASQIVSLQATKERLRGE